jgi:8-oxo-dGTP diphosphatase
MTPAITAGLLHDLVTRSHAEGITALGVEAVIDHDDRVLLIAEPGPDFTGDTWQLPGGPVLPGQTLTDALHPAVAAIGLTIDEITGYLGHHDHAGQHTTRIFCFAVTVTDPEAICRSAMRDTAGPTPATCPTPSTRRRADGPPPGRAVLHATRQRRPPDEDPRSR